MLNFIFNDETDKKLPANKCNNKSMLILANQINNGTKIYWDMDEYYNPIGQTGVFFSLRIDSDDTHLKISVNNGSYLYYKHHLPPWAVNWISPLDNLEHLTKSYEYEKELHSGEMFRLKLKIDKDNYICEYETKYQENTFKFRQIIKASATQYISVNGLDELKINVVYGKNN
uniref:Galectin n=1 Tax=Meloidogyne hapla TaxID=6305 RepID=A0A1I8B3D2_MELHA